MSRKQIIGFTGTRRGLTAKQHSHLVMALPVDGETEFHHGDCVGADFDAHNHALFMCERIVIHPPDSGRLRAFCASGRTAGVCEVLEPKPYIERNHDIVDVCDRLIACPGEMTEQRRSGTWATVRYAVKVGKPVLIIFPNGSEQKR